MSGPFKNDSGRHWLLREAEPLLSLFICFAPLAALGLEALLSGSKPFFALGLFAAASVIECGVDLWLYSSGPLHAPRSAPLGKFGRDRRARWLQYLNRTVLGLPLTIYLATSAVSPITGLLRLLPVLYLLRTTTALRQALLHFGFYCGGLLVYAAGLRYAWPGEREGYLLFAAVTAGALLYWLTEQRSRRQLRGLQNTRDLARARRRLAHTAEREERLLETLLVDRETVRRYQLDRPVRPLAEDRLLVVGIDFPGLHAAAAAWQRRAREAGENGALSMQAWEREWDLCVDHYRRGFQAAGYGCYAGDDGLLVVQPAGTSSEPGWAGHAVAVEERIVLHWTLLIRQLLAFSSRSRRSLESRGRMGWGTRAVILAGPGSLARRGPQNPGRVGRGEVFGRLADFQQAHAAPGVSSVPGASGERLYLDSALATTTRLLFTEASGASGPAFDSENWFSPGQIRADYDKDVLALNQLAEAEQISELDRLLERLRAR